MSKPNLPGKSTLPILPTPKQSLPDVVKLRGNNATYATSQLPPGFPPIQRQARPKESLPNSGIASNVWFGNVDEEASKINSEKITFDEVKSPPSIYGQLAAPTVMVDNFYLMVRGKLIHTTSTLEEMEEVIQYYLFSEQIEYPDLTVEDVVVLKKMTAKVGVSLRDV